MDQSLGNRDRSALGLQRRQFGRRFARLLWTNNPFYLISAWLVFSGLRASFNTGGETFETWALLGGLAAYTLLLATAACVLVHLGRVWEDIRTLVLLVVLMFLAISMSLDEALTMNPTRGSFWLTAGFVFAAIVSESLLAGLRVRLPFAYRLPYYLILALFFLYPVALAPWLHVPDSAEPRWGLFAYSAVAGLTLLTLLPAIRRGPKLVVDNGTPWQWPFYPLSLFFMLALAIGARAYSLCLSLHFVGHDWSIFGSYFIVPLLAAVNLLWLELGLTMRKRTVVVAALAAPLVWICLAQTAPRDDRVFLDFLRNFQETLHATPLFAALLIAVAFYSLAALRRVKGASEAGLATVAAMSLIDPRTLSFAGPYELTGWPLLVVGALLLISAVGRHQSVMAAVAAFLFVAGSAIEFRGTWFTSIGLTGFGEAVPLELLLGALLVVIAAFRDRHVTLVRVAAAVLLVWVSGVVSTSHGQILPEPEWLLSAIHLLFWAGTALVFGYWLKLRSFYLAAGAGTALWGVFAMLHSYRVLRTRVAGLREIALGLAFFALAFVVSIWKTRRHGQATERQEIAAAGQGDGG